MAERFKPPFKPFSFLSRFELLPRRKSLKILGVYFGRPKPDMYRADFEELKARLVALREDVEDTVTGISDQIGILAGELAKHDALAGELNKLIG